MSIKLRALGLGLLAMIAVGAIAVMNASAESSANGHFVSELPAPGVTKLDVTTTPGTSHSFEFGTEGLTGIVCHDATYTASFVATTSHITVTPIYKDCFTTGGAKGETTVTTNGCDFTFTKPAINATATVNTVQLTCPAGVPGIEIHHAGCKITVMPHHFKGIGYTTDIGASKHAITLTANVTLPNGTVTLENGFCVLLGTNKGATLKGSATITGTDAAGNPVGITATGGA